MSSERKRGNRECTKLRFGSVKAVDQAVKETIGVVQHVDQETSDITLEKVSQKPTTSCSLAHAHSE